jgi:cobalt/nickel transport system permease protein
MHIHALDAHCPRDSAIHRLDSRVKLILTLLFVVSVALVPENRWAAYAALVALALSVVAASRLGVGLVQRRAAVALPFALAAVSVVFSTPGRPVLTVPILGRDVSATASGLTRFVSIMLKSWLSVQMAVVLTASTPFHHLLQAMRDIGLPSVIVAVAGFAYRYIFVIGDEALRMMQARAARSGTLGNRSGGSVLWRAQVTGGMAGSLFLRSIERSERIFGAMVARGYDGEPRALRPPALRPRDLWIALPFALVLAIIPLVARMPW